jgi:hypothetical protein
VSALPLAHVGGMPIEETLGFYGPALLLAAGAASANLSARLRRLSRHRQQPPPQRHAPLRNRGSRRVHGVEEQDS